MVSSMYVTFFVLLTRQGLVCTILLAWLLLCLVYSMLPHHLHPTRHPTFLLYRLMLHIGQLPKLAYWVIWYKI
jgi:hypothetical protein